MASAVLAGGYSMARGKKKIPVIFHTDIGDDIDDLWALLLLLRRPEFDLKLVVVDTKNMVYRARLAAKLLQLAGRGMVPIAMGPNATDLPGNQSEWLGDYQLSQYPVPAGNDGAWAIGEFIASSADPVTVISVGPATLIAESLTRRPEITRNARFVGMFGSIRVGYGGKSTPDIEYNVKVDPAALRTVFAADWSCTITPLDTCGSLELSGPPYQKLRRSTDPLAQIAVTSSISWRPHATWLPEGRHDFLKATSPLFDAVAVVMAVDESDLVMETLPLTVREDGMMLVDPSGRPVRCATAWRDLPRFKARMVDDLMKFPLERS